MEWDQVDIARVVPVVHDGVMSHNGSALSRDYPNELPEKAGDQTQRRVREPLSIAFRQMPNRQRSGAIEDFSSPNPGLAWKSGRIAIKASGVILLIDPAEILVAEAQGNYVLLQGKGSHLLREQISVLAEKLHSYGFIRIHRSVLVNAAHVEGMEALLTGEYLLRMKGGKEYKVTRTYKKNLQFLASTWIGTGNFVDE